MTEQERIERDLNEKETDYQLHALFCDYYEWLASPRTRPIDERIKAKYRSKMHNINLEIARRYKEEVS